MKYILLIACIMITFPSIAQTDWPNLKRYAAENAALPAPVKGEKRVVFMGNSITEGWIKTDSAFFKEHPFINRGISGQTTPQMLLRFRPDVIALQPKAVVILAGVNDIAENTGPIALKDVAGNIFSMAELAKAHKIKVFICSVLPANTFPWRREIKPADKVIELNAMLKAYCSRENIPYIDYYTSMADTEKGLPPKYGNDGVHPNAEGYKVMEDILMPALSKL